MQPERVVLSPERLASAIGDRWSAAEVGEVVGLLEDGEGKFPPGTRTVPEGLVRAVQRERILVAMLRAIAQLGYRDANVQHVLDRAGVSRPTFYELFENKEDCFLAAFDATAERLWEQVEAASRRGERRCDRLESGLRALLGFLVAERDAARALIVEARAASPAGLRRRDRLLERFTACIDSQLRDELPEPPAPIAAAGVVGGIEAVLYSRINAGEFDQLASLLPSLMHFAMLPFRSRPTAAEGAG